MLGFSNIICWILCKEYEILNSVGPYKRRSLSPAERGWTFENIISLELHCKDETFAEKSRYIWAIFRRFPNIFRRFPKIFKILRTVSEVHTNISDHFPKISEDCRRLPNVSEQSSKMFRSHRNEFRFVRQLNLVNVIAHTTSLLSSRVKISNLSSDVKISCFHSKRNPCNSLKFI